MKYIDYVEDEEGNKIIRGKKLPKDYDPVTLPLRKIKIIEPDYPWFECRKHKFRAKTKDWRRICALMILRKQCKNCPIAKEIPTEMVLEWKRRIRESWTKIGNLDLFNNNFIEIDSILEE
ncbi:hypothetical protein J7J62_03880 [bacterium]|nr:hypothetical protein [bacterium]